MNVGRATHFAILAIGRLSHNKAGSVVQAQHIAEDTGVPIEYLRKILQRLARARLITSGRGRGGGFALGKPLKAISFADVVEAIEGPLDAHALFDEGLLPAASSTVSPRINRWRKKASKDIRQILDATSLDSLLS